MAENKMADLRNLLGDLVVDNIGNEFDVDTLNGKIVGLYFSAHW
jgi:hypothetical protein